MEQSELQEIWEQILQKVLDQKSLTELTLNDWLRPVKPLSLSETSLVLGAPTALAREWIAKRYIPFLEDAVLDLTKKKLRIEIKNLDIKPKTNDYPSPPIQETLLPENNSSSPMLQEIICAEKPLVPYSTASQKTEGLARSYDMPGMIPPGDASSLNSHYTFDTFVTGNSNRFAHAAALAVAESPGKVYNPFFMYGGVGLGKTHLMHAIGHKILEKFPEMRVLYISSEKFTNELINSIRDGNPESFRQKYRNIDILLVDDIQFLSKKEHTQEEFFHTFNTLHDANKHIILSSDRHPREIQTLEDRLRSRFEWGLITDIQAPDLETRIAILRKKAALEHLDVPNDVMFSIANRIDNNIRELEGALTRVVAYASLTQQPITPSLVNEALANIFPSGKSREVTMELIQEVVASYFKLRLDDLHAKKRTRNLAMPRQIAMYLCRELTNNSLPQIGASFGGRDHTTVIHAYDKISKERQEDSKLDRTIEQLMQRIENL
ncbi:chromosomal replication initiator protein DnaA [Selenomonas sp.]|uniref:chromosomal replication initiator protein DnaA n=1 Tax=Selenomonas sp. TaxID=2053611 RepID=UPI003FA33A96